MIQNTLSKLKSMLLVLDKEILKKTYPTKGKLDEIGT
jgi:hypothetical protein